MTRCCVALGGNLGAVDRCFSQALDSLCRSHCDVTAVSSLYRTAPVATGATGDFLNAAALLETARLPESLLNLLQSIEQSSGRTRERRWGPRTLDLDLIFFGEEIIQSPTLTVPHPAAWFRRFVLDPVAELLPDFVHPVKQISIGALRRRLLVRPLTIAIAGGDSRSNSVAADLARRSDVSFVDWIERGRAQRLEPELTFIVWCGDATTELSFRELPLVPRIDATRECPNTPVDEFLRYLLDAALGNVAPIAAPGEWWRPASESHDALCRRAVRPAETTSEPPGSSRRSAPDGGDEPRRSLD